jgi:AcrR family transcriptional regulator
LSGDSQAGRAAGDVDRRTRKTHDALLNAFNELMLDRRYDEFGVADIVEDADVGRSTFYEHYRGKDDLLVHSMSWMLDVLAEAAFGPGDGAELEGLLAHFLENRDMGRYLLVGPPAREVLPRLVHELAQRIERRVEASLRERGTEPALPPRLIALQTAEAQFGLIKAWLRDPSPCAPAEVASGMRRSAAAGVAALLQSGVGR